MCSIHTIAVPAACTSLMVSISARHLGFRQAAGDFVKQQQPWAGGECARHLEPLALE